MRSVIGGAHSHLEVFIIRGHIKLLAKRNAALKLLGLEVRKCALDNLVEKGLEDLEWTWEDGKWAHAYLPNGFAEEDVLDDKKWNKISHAIRESYRCVAFNRLCVSDRHDAREIREIPYSEKRRKLAVSWAVKDASFTAFMLILGGIQSPHQRAFYGYRRITLRCPVCGLEAPPWQHLWQCFVGYEPDDGLLYRFLWPRGVADFAICNAFLSGMRLIER